MTKEEITMLGFEIVAYAGEARSKLIEALEAAKKAIMTRQRRFVNQPINPF